MTPDHILIALEELGVEEWKGDASNPRVEEYIQATPRGLWGSPTDAVSWCGAFCAWTAREAGLSVPDDAHRARAWKGHGTKVAEPWLGDFCVVQLEPRYRRRRGRTGSARGGRHVGWLMNVSRGAPVLLSGNVDNRVGIDWYNPVVWRVEYYGRPEVVVF